MNRKESTWIVRVADEVADCTRKGKSLIVSVPGWRDVTLTPQSKGLAEALVSLRGPGASFDALSAGLSEAGRQELLFLLERLERARLLEWAVLEEGQEIACLKSLSAAFHLDYGSRETAPLRLSRFAYLRRLPVVEEGDQAVLESGASRARMILQPRAAERLAALTAAACPASAHAIFDLARRAGLAESLEQEEPEARRSWEFHDRLFHEVSRGCRETDPFGGTYRMTGIVASPPAVVALSNGPRVALPSPSLQESQPLDQILAHRRSNRRYADEPIDLQQISDLLYRSLRTKSLHKSEPQDLIRRPYPSGGSLHELQFYLAVGCCKDLESGLYRYSGEEHALIPCGCDSPQLEKLLARSGSAMGKADDWPQILLIVTTRHPRMAWKYEAMAYRASLMNVGVVFQTLYLVATDLGLAACANGGGNSRGFEEASGLDPWEETAVGEFALGRAA
ncbi:MAG: hypothetical protein Kilf2KO_13550 [Rhodospirillales bacterium]